MSRITLATFLTLFGLGGCLGGCASLQKKPIEEQREFLKMVSDFARENDMAVAITAAYDGDTSVYGKTSFGVKTGAVVQATLIANAADPDGAQDGTTNPGFPPGAVVISGEPVPNN